VSSSILFILQCGIDTIMSATKPKKVQIAEGADSAKKVSKKIAPEAVEDEAAADKARSPAKEKKAKTADSAEKKKKAKAKPAEAEADDADAESTPVNEEKPKKKKKKAAATEEDAAPSAEEPSEELPKKKKKKKSTAAVTDAASASGEEEAAPEELPKKKKKKADKEGGAKDQAEKKKKKKAKEAKEAEEKEETAAEPEVETKESKPEADEPVEEDVLDFELSLASKKKKKKQPTTTEETVEVIGGPEKKSDGTPAWLGSDRDYTYTELLERVFTLLREKNPNLAGARKRHVMPPPQVVRVGTKKTMWTNFAIITQLMHRSLDHFMSFVMAELGTEGSIDGNQRLLIKGKYGPKQMESLLKKYITEYVACSICRNPETSLTRDAVRRLYFIQCESCGARRSVAPIKSGFHAQSRTERRRALNA